jgi:anti-sigma factor RsiW
MSERRDDRLMQHFDGELSESEAAEMERLLAESPEARALLRDFDVIGRTLRDAAEERGVAAADIADRVMAQIEAEPPRRASVVVPLRRRTRVATLAPALVLAFAAAAAVMLLVRREPPQPLVKEDDQIAQLEELIPSAAPEPPPEAVASVDEDDLDDFEPGASIESVDFGSENGTIFMVPSGPDSTPVVWMSDDSDRMEAL